MAEDEVRYAVWGSAGHAKVLCCLIDLRGGRVVALFDNAPDAVSVLDGVPLYHGEQGLRSWRIQQDKVDDVRCLAAIGGARGRDRLAIHERFTVHGLQVADALVHPLAAVCSTSRLGKGTQVLALAIVAAGARLGEACILNHRAAVDHECMLGDGVHLAPGATLCGCVSLGDNVMIGACAVVLPRLSIGANTIVGAGAVVTKSLPADVVAVGNPARIVRRF